MKKTKWFIENVTESDYRYIAGNEEGYGSELVAKGVMKELEELFPEYKYKIFRTPRG